MAKKHWFSKQDPQAGGQPAGNQPPIYPNGPQATGYQSPYPNGPQPTGYQSPYPNGPQATGYQSPYPNGPQATGYQSPYPNPPQATGYQAPYPNGPQPTGYQSPYPNPPQATGYQAPYPNAPQGTAYQTAYPNPPQGTAYQNAPVQQTATGQMTAAEQPPKPVKPPRPRMPGLGRILTRIFLWVLLVVLLLGGWFLYSSSMQRRATLATIEVGNLGSRYTGRTLIVRNETPYNADSVTSIEYQAEEGRVVNRGMSICSVFSSGYSTREMTTLQDYRDQIRDYQIGLIASETTYDAKMTRTETDVMSRAREVRDMISGTNGNLINQEKLLKTAILARQNYLKSKYANDQRMSRLYDDESAQQQRIDSWTKPFVAASDAIVSFYSDGYEYSLTGTNWDTFTPNEVRSMINGGRPANENALSRSKTTIYRMIDDGEWYVLFLADDENWMPVEGETYELQLEHFDNTQVSAYVVSTTRSGGELLVRLRVNSSVEPVLYIRSCQAELGDSESTLMVPKTAIYEQDEMKGVVVSDGANQYFVPVKIVYQDKDTVYISSITAGLLYEGQTVRLFN